MDKNISLGQAFAHCASTDSYWIWIIIAVVVSITAGMILTRANSKSEVNPMVKMLVYFAIAALILCSIFVRPCTIAANTTQEQAARGVYIGY
jgi:hypothetical protein